MEWWENRKSPFGNRHRGGRSIRNNPWRFDKEQDTDIISESLSTTYRSITKGDGEFRRRKLASTNVTRGPSFTTPGGMKHCHVPPDMGHWFFFFFCHTTQLVGSWLPNQGSNPRPLLWKHGILTTGPPGEPHGALIDHSIISVVLLPRKHGLNMEWREWGSFGLRVILQNVKTRTP